MKLGVSRFDYEVERMDDLTKVPPHWVAEHKARYDLAKSFCKEKIVLDAGCGIGYGSDILAQKAQTVWGVDIDASAIKKARMQYATKHIAFQQMDLTNLAFKEDSFDVVVSFEVIEHIKNYESYLLEITRVLIDKGMFILSTPNAIFSQDEFNRYHFHEFYLQELIDVLSLKFHEVHIFGQSVNLKAAAMYQNYFGILINRIKKKLGIQFIFPKKVKRFVERLLTGESMCDAKPQDFSISRDNMEKSPVYIGICRYKK